MRQMLLILVTCLALSSCSYLRVQKMDVQQGNIYTDAMVQQLHPGMTLAEVKAIMGTPTLKNTFDDNRVDYIYTFKPGYGDFQEKKLTLKFNHGQLSTIRKG